MSEIILHYKGGFNVFETISDSIVFSSAVELNFLIQILKTERGTSNFNNSHAGVVRAVELGTSTRPNTSLEEFYSRHHVDAEGFSVFDSDRIPLTFDQFVEHFLTVRERFIVRKDLDADALIKIATLELADFKPEFLEGFATGLGIQRHELRQWLKENIPERLYNTVN